MSWSRLEADAPELARLCRSRLEEPGVALLGTLRGDGSPRIDPVEPHFVEGELVLGVMARSAKALALRRDARCVVHSTISGPNSGEPDVKLFGRVGPTAVQAGWWAGRPAEEAQSYALELQEVVAIEWDIPASRMVVHRWTPGAGETVSVRTYP